MDFEWLWIYLAGSGVALAAFLLHWLVYSIATAITGDRTLGKNLRKLMSKEDLKTVNQFSLGCGAFIVFLSWLGVLWLACSIVWGLLKALLRGIKAVFIPLPEAAKIFR